MFRYPSFLPLFFHSDHGVNISSDIDPAILDLRKKTYFFCWNRQVIERYGDNKYIKFIKTEHPYRVMFDRVPHNKKSQGSIFFPSHSSGGYVITGIDDTDSIRCLHSLPSEYFPVTVCLHASDFHTSRRNFFEENGFQVTWLGDINSKNFVSRLIDELANKRFVISEAWGSQVAFAVAMGKPTTISPRDIEIHSLENSIEIVGNSDPFYVSEKKRVEALFAELLPELSGEQKDYIQERLGYDFKRRRWKNSVLAYSLIFRVGLKWFLVNWLGQFLKILGRKFRKSI
jgi:hypothetical protein